MTMQQTKSYWRLVAALGVVSAFVASACVVTTSTDDDDNGGSGGSGAKAGSSTTGGSATGGHATGGSGTAGNGTAGNGTAGSGVSFMCDDPQNAAGAPGEGGGCEPSDSTDECQVCIQQKCCAEYSACIATDPNNQCGYGGPALVNDMPNDGGELLCMHECLKKAVATSMISATAEDIGTCANQCLTPSCLMATVGYQTSDVIGCINSNCSMKCWGPK
jgi:hypothetical protein